MTRRANRPRSTSRSAAPPSANPAAPPARRGIATGGAAPNRAPVGARRLKPLGAAALLVALVVIAYLPALRAGFIWDDDAYVQKNAHLRSLAGLGRVWFDVHAAPQYYPLVHTSYWLEYRVWGLSPAGYHAVNVLLHGIAAALLWRVLVRLTGGIGPPDSGAESAIACATSPPEVGPAARTWTWLAAAVFALHPVHVESVAWITERKNVLSAVFYFAAALAYLSFAERRRRGDRASDLRGGPASARAGRLYALALLLFLGALLSKTVTCTLPVVLALALWWRYGRLRAGDLYPLLPLLVLGAAFGLLTAWLERTHVQATGADWSLSGLERILIACRAVWFYVGKLVWPHPLIFFYPRWPIDSGAWPQYLAPAALVAVLIALALTCRRLGRAPLAAALAFLVTLAPALGFFNVYPMRYAFVADHFQYLASVPLLVLLVLGGRALLAALRAPARQVAAVVALALLAVLGGLTFRQARIYRDLETLWRDTLAKNPAAFAAHTNLGNLLVARGRSDDALVHLRRAVQLAPDDVESVTSLASALTDVRPAEARELFETALRLDPRHPPALFNYAQLLRATGELDAAIATWEQALALEPADVGARLDLGCVYRLRGRFDDAEAAFRDALRRAPDQWQPHMLLGILLKDRDRPGEAAAHLRQALAIEPRQPHARQALAELATSHPAAINPDP